LGAPIALKDNFCTKDLTTTASSNILRRFQPPFDSAVITKLRRAGASFLGKTNLDAFAHGSSTETSDFGTTKNPRNRAHVPGGSSGGSAAAVAANLCLAALGSETAGSVRQPASLCGVVGMRGTYGRASRYGIAAMASSLDSPGWLTKTVADSAYLMNIISGRDEKDATTISSPLPDLLTIAKNSESLAGVKIGVQYLELEGLEKIKPYYEKVTKTLEGLGASVELVESIDPHLAISVYTVLMRSEVSSNLARYDGVRYGQDRSFFGDEAKRRIMLGTYTLSKGYADRYYLLAQKVRTLLIKEYERLFSQYDVLISPSYPGFAKKIGAAEGNMLFGELEDILVEPSALAGLPAISVPCYHDNETNLFLGLNIMGKPLDEAGIVKVAAAYEKAAGINEWL
jgi:aspartyl-tRNA(Asn)/glutamyl-tRNA(Gln) amidotransferase subunit A